MARKKNLDRTELLVLALLSREDLYGYQMIAELDRQSNQKARCTPCSTAWKTPGPCLPTAPLPPRERSGNTTT